MTMKIRRYGSSIFRLLAPAAPTPSASNTIGPRQHATAPSAAIKAPAMPHLLALSVAFI